MNRSSGSQSLRLSSELVAPGDLAMGNASAYTAKNNIRSKTMP